MLSSVSASSPAAPSSSWPCGTDSRSPSVEDLVRAADTLMYEAKSAGQDRVRQVTVSAGPPANETGETP
jgi:hypothetical protein